jgi:7,8-dihydropterin-6-yl-methyl-4-(beta-D-ribofuranosyl)aminobenzene 5'-phosphate synthase
MMAESGQINQLIITILIDNTAGKQGTVGEKGFSALAEIEYEGGDTRKILFDTGATGTNLLNNLKVLNKDLQDLDCIVFSHGHWDHVWGIKEILPLVGPEVFLFCHPAALDKKWRLDEEGGTEIISLHQVISPERLFELIPIRTSPEPEEIFPGVFSTGAIPRQNPHEVLSKGLSRIHIDGAAGPEVDQIPEDLSLIFEIADGSIVILTGCCHAGVVNTINHARNITPFAKIAGLIGGLHLLDAPQPRLDFTMEELGKLNIGEIGACHCTGPLGIHTLKNAFPEQFKDVEVGVQLKYPVP